ncbi:hypothetical protein GSI_03569 [Ganoderma sinense ZZ0214-1]|uniref:Uncharacterized protein n=1 Tax=Ganoderma sinense ZZ0214-1 TaxID=1077348 RepID=A0A2G8SJC0_9APHY|nr:hypothetical protein GSI_03569 [Ganoderma sinense ZZ0214-1]
MPRYTSVRASSKRKREPSPEDNKVPIAISPNAADASDAPSQNKRPRRAAALKAEAKMQVKEEEDDSIPIPLNSNPAAVKLPEPGSKVDSDVKVETKPEPSPPKAVVSKATAKRGRRMPTKQTPAAAPSTTLPSRAGQKADEEQDATLTLSADPSAGPSKAQKKGGNKGPTKMELKKAREEKWKKWCDARKWIRQYDPGYKQKVGDVVAHRSDAMAYYRFTAYEIDTTPYVAFDNKHNPNSFGRAYNNSNLRTLVSRKLAYLAGLDERLDPETKEVEFLKAGWELFETATKKREETVKQKGNTRKALKLWRIVPRREPNPTVVHHHTIKKSRPFGSWSTRVYEDGRYIGDWLHFQFDPYADDYADFYEGYERFWPVGADWAWEIGGLCSCCDL